MTKSAVVIPIYQPLINKYEEISLNQCTKVLGSHPIIFVCPYSLNTAIYQTLVPDATIERFEDDYFDGIAGYNRLLLSLGFYKRFAKFEYILIYQLDAYVFRDELEYWCNQGYDYIGAPWFENCGSHEEGDKLWHVGNGGFSLRKVKRFIQILSYKGPVYKPSHLRSQTSFRKSTNLLCTVTFLIFKCIGYKNSVPYLLKRNKEHEDWFWTNLFHHSWIKFSVASTEIALKFAFEKSPAYLYTQNNEQLPFGCHAWQKYEYESFWNRYIGTNK